VELRDACRADRRHDRQYDPVLFSPSSALPTGWAATTGASSEEPEEAGAGAAAGGGATAPSQPRVFAVDCEMVECEGLHNALARVSLVERLAPSGELVTVLDEFVRPPGAVVDYRTAVSGVSAADVDGAPLDLAGARAAVCAFVHEGDWLLGHQLSSDLKALQLRHCNRVDTALLFGVRGMPGWTLSLKDLVLHFFGGKSGAAGGFQAAGEAHDSAEDARWALRLVARQATRLCRGEEREELLDAVPERFLRQLHVKWLPRGADVADLRAMLEEAGAGLPEGASVRPMKAQGSPGGGKEGAAGAAANSSTVVELACAEAAAEVFAALQRKWGPAWPEEDGFMCCRLRGPPARASGAPEPVVKSYQRPQLGCREVGKVSRDVIGRVIGKAGARLREIRRQSGALVVVRKRAPGDAEQDTQEVEIKADTLAKVQAAKQLLQRAADGDRLGV